MAGRIEAPLLLPCLLSLCHRRGKDLVLISYPLLADDVLTRAPTGKSASRVLLVHVRFQQYYVDAKAGGGMAQLSGRSIDCFLG